MGRTLAWAVILSVILAGCAHKSSSPANGAGAQDAICATASVMMTKDRQAVEGADSVDTHVAILNSDSFRSHVAQPTSGVNFEATRVQRGAIIRLGFGGESHGTVVKACETTLAAALKVHDAHHVNEVLTWLEGEKLRARTELDKAVKSLHAFDAQLTPDGLLISLEDYEKLLVEELMEHQRAMRRNVGARSRALQKQADEVQAQLFALAPKKIERDRLQREVANHRAVLDAIRGRQAESLLENEPNLVILDACHVTRCQ